MTETTKDKKTDKEADKKKPLSISRPGKLELKKTVEQGQIKQSFSHGRTKAVTVEVRKKRTYAPNAGGTMAEVKSKDGNPLTAGQGVPAGDEHLTSQEKVVRAKALEGSIIDEERRSREEAAATIVREEAAALEEAARLKEEKKKKAEEAESKPEPKADAAPDIAALESLAPAEGETARAPRKGKAEAAPRAEVGRVEEEKAGKGAKADKGRPALTLRKEDDPRRRGKLTIAKALDDESGERVRSLASVRRARERERRAQAGQARGEAVKIIREVVVPETITVQELSNRMAERAGDVIKKLMSIGVTASITETIDADTAELVIAEFGHVMKRISAADVEEGMGGEEDAPESLKKRPPVVTVMGHVDHGKTSLLDALRKTDVASGESGGITQHIGAYQVTVKSGEKITFLDTPGHEAFTQMRARGAKVTDIVILVVAADDGIMPQTIEAIHHAQAAEVPMIVAINKIDVAGADAERIKIDLLQHDVALEGLGGDVLWIEVSAKEGTNLDKLEEMILLQAEILELKANPDRSAQGIVVEAKVERGRGNVATALVHRGTLRVGDVFVAGSEWGRVRALSNDHGSKIKLASPSMPVEVLGLNGAPIAGDEFMVVENETKARQIAEYRQRAVRDAAAVASTRDSVEEMLASIASGEAKELPVVIKADVQGSVEAIVSALGKIGNEEVRTNVLHSGVGGINESDVTLARASNALVFGFNVRPNPQARVMSERDGIEIRYYSIIYDLTNDVTQALTGMLDPDTKETRLGSAEVREVFSITKVGKIAGCLIADGVVRRGAKVRLLRDSVVIHEGDLETLKHFKDEVKEVRAGSECGMALENYHDIQAGDVIECFEVEQVARTL